MVAGNASCRTETFARHFSSDQISVCPRSCNPYNGANFQANPQIPARFLRPRPAMTVSPILVLIPARMAATRLPGKPLLDIGGLPMIVHVMRRAEAARLGRVAVATDTPEIAAAVTLHGGEAVMTSAEHPSGSDRIYEALCKLDPAGRIDSIVNL